MKRFLMIAVLCSAVLLSGCGQLFKGEKGDAGSPGSRGVDGTAGVSLIKTYTGVMTGATVQTMVIPEIKGLPDNTFVMVYTSFPTSAVIWTPVTDGWLDSEAMCYFVSWIAGSVSIYQGFAGNNYMIKVYRNN
jgi:hypothetical protein